MPPTQYDYDVFVSYRWVNPDQVWVREALVPALAAAGLKVCLDVNDFIPGRNLMLEMDRAGRSSRRALCILSDDYFSGNRMVLFESLSALRDDPGGMDSRLVPLVLRKTELPEWIRGLVPIDWTDNQARPREWKKLLKVLGAPRTSASPVSVSERTSAKSSTIVFLHDYNLPSKFVARDGELTGLLKLLTQDAGALNQTRVAAITAIGGVGKSCLARALVEQPDIAASFARVIWFSFYEARTESQEYFLREVWLHGCDCNDDESPQEGVKEAARLRRALSRALARERVLLILDGLEVVQFTDDPKSPKYGAIKPICGEVEKLIRSMLNEASSVCVVTSRVPLRPLEGTRGYRNVSLDLFTRTEGALLLQSLGVQGDFMDLEACAESMGGHALSLVAAGRFMSRRKIPAEKWVDLVGDPDLFQRTAEGEKVKKICEWYRSELTPEQEYFLTRLSLVGRSVTAQHFAVLVMNFAAMGDESAIHDQIIQPLVDFGLVDQLESSDSLVRYSAHPLMKLAYSTWLEPEQTKRAHEQWARAAAAAPGLFFNVSSATNLEELQPLIDATEQYLAADQWREAWRIYSDRNLGSRLGQLGYFELSFGLAQQFEEARRQKNDWSDNESVMLFDKLAWLSARLERKEDTYRYRQMELSAARAGKFLQLDEVERLVAETLARDGFVREALDVNPSGVEARASLALAQGYYGKAARLLLPSFKKKSGHDRTTISQELAEALYRSGKSDKAEIVLKEGLEIAIREGFACCRSAILFKLSEVALRRNNATEAAALWEMRNELRRSLDLDPEENSWLLCAQGDYEAAMGAAEKNIAANPRSVIQRHVDRARIFSHLGERVRAIAEVESAEREQAASAFKQLNNDVLELRNRLRAR